MNYIDYIIIGVLLLYMIIGYFKGFMISVLSLFSFTVKFIISLLLCKPALLFTNNVCKLDVALSNSFINKFGKTSELFTQNMNNMTQAEIDTHITNCLNTTKYPSFLKSYFKSIFTIQEGQSNYTFADVIGNTLGRFCSFIITFVIVFILITIILLILKKQCKKITENSVTVRKVDRFTGIIYGAVRGSVNIIVIFAILSWFKTFSFLTEFYTAIESSFFGGIISNLIFPFMDKYINLKEIAKWFINLL